MRVSRKRAAQNRENVVHLAGQKFRELGYDGIGVAGLMDAVGLTHGGFYKQFKDKEALIVEATSKALASNLKDWREIMAKASGDPAKALRRWYLSKEHLKRIGEGCVYAALAAEAPRHGPVLRQAFEQALEASISELAAAADGSESADARGQAIRDLALMIGSLVLARSVNGRGLAAEVLKCGQDG